MQVYLFFGRIQNIIMKSINRKARKGIRKGRKGKNSLCSLHAEKTPGSAKSPDFVEKNVIHSFS
jgi:hypothetical protein